MSGSPTRMRALIANVQAEARLRRKALEVA